MSFQVSPGILVKEIDNTASIAPVSTSTGAFVGNFRWGPVEQVTSISTETNLGTIFGTPTKETTIDFHTAAYFLRYSNSLNVVRAVTSACRTANGAGDTATVVKNDDQYDTLTLAHSTVGMWIARYPGALGNSLKVEVFGFKTDASTTDTNFNSWAYKSYFTGPVGTSDYASRFSSSNDEVHVIVIDEDGLFTGVPGTVLETFEFLSQAPDAKSYDGSSLYFKDKVNTTSKYIRFGGLDATDTPNAGTDADTGSVDYAVAPLTGVISASLTGGVDSAALDTSEFATGWDLFEDGDTVDVSLLIAPNLPANNRTAIANDVISCAVGRKDCVAFISPDKDSDTAAEIVTFGETLTYTSYAVVDSGRLKVYDKYNDMYINIPACSSVAGLCSQTDRTHDAWYSPAGLERGQLLGVTQLVYNPSQTDRDTLYKKGINPIMTSPGEGTLLFGDKTHQSRPSAFDRINVRRLFIVLEKAISRASRSFLFDFNDEFTRAQFISLVDPFLRTVQGRRGITAYEVVCDESNNPGDVIDRNEFVGDIYIKPARSINYITLNFIATRTGVSFSEVTGG